MYRQSNAKNRIQYALAHVVTWINMANKLNLTDLNIEAEDFFKKLFNLIYGYNLQNANLLKQNDEAIDLHDINKKIAYQITSTNKPIKIKNAIDTFIQAEKYKSFSNFIIFSINNAKKCKDDALAKLNNYGVTGSYVNVTDFEREIFHNLDTSKLETVANFLENELPIRPFKKIQDFSKVDESIKSLHIVDQLFHILNYFKGFKCIYPRSLAKLYPLTHRKKFMTVIQIIA